MTAGLAGSDEELVRRFVESRDEGAYEALVHRHLGSIRRILYAVLGGRRDDVAEAEQEVLVALVGSLRSFRYRSSFRTWLYRFTRNRGIDHLRRLKRRAARERSAAPQLPEDPEGDPVQTLLREETRVAILDALGRLPARERIAVTLREVEGMSLVEVAEVLRVPVGTVKSRLSRGRGRLAAMLSDLGVGRA